MTGGKVAEKHRLAWLHKGDSFYYTDEQMEAEAKPELKRFYIKFIEYSAYEQLRSIADAHAADAMCARGERDALKAEISGLSENLAISNKAAVEADGRAKSWSVNSDYARLMVKFREIEAENERLKKYLTSVGAKL